MAAYAGFMTHVTCRLTAENRDQVRNSTLGSRVWATFIFTPVHIADGISFGSAVLRDSLLGTSESITIMDIE